MGQCRKQELETMFKVSSDLKDVVEEKTTVTVTGCTKPKGYVLIGDKKITCQHDGSWSQESECRKCGNVLIENFWNLQVLCNSQT